MAATIVQPTIVYGPYCVPWTNAPAESLIFGDVILTDGDVGVCNAIYIDDLVDGLILAAVSPAAVGERFLMSGPPVTWAMFFTEMARVLGTGPAQFWSSERIQEHKEQARKSQKTAVSPKSVLKAIAGWGPARKAMEASFEVLPATLRKKVAGKFGSSGNRPRGGIFLPQPMYSSKTTVGSEKAKLKLDFRPNLDFQGGMELTGRYLKWAYANDLPSAKSGPPRPAPGKTLA